MRLILNTLYYSSLQSFMMAVQRPSRRGSGGLGPSSTFPQRFRVPKAPSVRTHSDTREGILSVRRVLEKDPPVSPSSQVQPSDTVMRREDGWSRTFTTAPRLRLWSSMLL